MKESKLKRRSGTTQAAQERKGGGCHSSPKGTRGYKRHPKHRHEEKEN